MKASLISVGDYLPVSFPFCLFLFLLLLLRTSRRGIFFLVRFPPHHKSLKEIIMTAKPASQCKEGKEGRVQDRCADGDEGLVTLLIQTLKILIPTDISGILMMASQTITLMFVGNHLGEKGMSEYSAGLLVFNVLAMSIVCGLGAAIDTISSQAYGHDPHSPLIGETLQRALVIDLVLWALMSIFFITSKPFMVFSFGEGLGEGGALFLAHCPLYLLAQIVSGVVSKTLLAQRQPSLVALANFVSAVASPFINYYLTPLGVHGAAWALGCTVSVCAIAVSLIAAFHPAVVIFDAPWPSPALLRKDEWITFLRVGLPSLVAVCAEWWAFELQACFAVTISPLALAVVGVFMNILSLLFALSLGISVSASVIVGNALGSGRYKFSKRYAKFIIICDIVLGVATAAALVYNGAFVARLYTNVPSVAKAVESTMPLVALTHMADSLQLCLQGIFRGAGQPKQAAQGVLLTLWFVGIPSIALYVLVFKWGVKGVIGGLLTGMVFEVILLYCLMSRWDWKKLAQKALELTEGEEKALLSTN
ncbi:membrane transporter protein, putative [Trypanosoma brucei brucei TREU927]|uniref:Membrane transporter protein, putative n=2 Tax=Trypanozoon TaxID=39700 RepID=Q389A3_TRYB2|nr:membrane transporter protein, putative [Trypanosoma brucei brucei TREU927]EAN78617.1 membrane transporter protein, putative [Trypanosoma brucei brucei TREU927]